MLHNILLALILTLLIELSISIVLGIRNKDLVRITIINILTNVPLNILIYLINGYINHFILNIVLIPIFEVIVILVEGMYYKKLNNSVIGKYKLSLLLNSLSYGCGILMTILFKII